MAVNFFTSTPGRYEQRPTLNPEQTSAVSNVLQMGQKGLQNTPSSFSPIREYLQRQHAQVTLPQLREQFSGQGESGALQGGLLGAENDLAARLGAMEQGFNQQDRAQFLSMIGQGLTPTFQDTYVPGESSSFSNLADPFIQSFAKKYPEYLLSGTSAGQSGDGSSDQDKESWWQWFQGILKSFGPAVAGAIHPAAGVAAQGAVNYSNMPSATPNPNRPSPFNQPKPQVNRSDFSPYNLNRAAGQLPQYSPLPFGVK